MLSFIFERRQTTEVFFVFENGACLRRAMVLRTLNASGDRTPVIQGTPGLMIPPFSCAIFRIVVPRICVCSNPIVVITETSGVMMFVASNLPPSPVSMTAISTCSSAKYLKAIAVTASKNVQCHSSTAGRIREVSRATVRAGIGRPSMRMRSLKLRRWGEV